MTGPAWPAAPAVVLDFDGVVCDGSTECALVTWYGHFNRPVEEFSTIGLPHVPATFLQRFRDLRGYARHLDHFLVPLLGGVEELPSQREFDVMFAAIPESIREGFRTRVDAYRAAVRRTYREEWLAHHSIYPGIGDGLRALEGDWYIVTAKDTASVLEVLAQRQIRLDPSRIYGEQTDKRAALREIGDLESSRTVVFVDDSHANVVAARADGVAAYWANWGFHNPEQAAAAQRSQTPTLTLEMLGRRLTEHAELRHQAMGAA